MKFYKINNDDARLLIFSKINLQSSIFNEELELINLKTFLILLLQENLTM